MISNILARLLEPSEREVVLGDLAERGAGAIETILELSGSIVRRQAAMWGHWRPWTALLLLIVPLSLALSTQSRLTSGNTSTYLWLYLNNWDWRLAGLTAFQYQFPRYIVEVLLSYLTLACYSWIGGFVIGGIARRALLSLGTLLAIALGLAEFAALPWLQSYIRAWPRRKPEWARRSVVLPGIDDLTGAIRPGLCPCSLWHEGRSENPRLPTLGSGHSVERSHPRNS